MAAFPPDAIVHLHENLPETGVDALTESDDILCIGKTAKVMDIFGVPRDDVLLMMLIREFRSLHLMFCGQRMP